MCSNEIKYDHMPPFHFENDFELDDKEQPTTINEESDCLFIDLQDGLMFHDFEDNPANLLESSAKEGFILFINIGIGFRFQVELASFIFFILLEENRSKNQPNCHFLDWIHWSCDIT
jgi:hypothetical protein